MSTPSMNTVPTTLVSVSSNDPAASLIDGVKWGGGLRNGVNLTFSFPTGTATFVSGYEEFSSWSAVSTLERSALIDALVKVTSVANVRVNQVADNTSAVGDLRLAVTNVAGADEAAHAYTPGDTPEAGDVWFSKLGWNEEGGAINPGDFDYTTALHEICHALGLKHPFEGGNQLASEYENYFYTVMSYTASPWSAQGDNYASYYPTTPMYYDILALQTLYGRNLNHNYGNTTYVYKQGATYFETIDDAGGTDTIRYDGSRNVVIQLAEGASSALGNAIVFSNGNASRHTVRIGPNTVIERAMGGSGSDHLSGNSSRNVIDGRGGNDTINGGAAGDRLVGGAGHDALTGGHGSDTFNFTKASDSGNTSTTRDRILDFIHRSDKMNFAGIDPVSKTIADDNFVWRGTNGLTTGTEGQLRYQQYNLSGTANDRTIVFGDTDSDINSEFQIELKGLITLTRDDFIL
jgi:Ca2+-binding RTX toxin-like protein